MSMFLVLAFLFYLGSSLGWILELFFRRWNNPNKKWVNPGFCTGPYLPLYGFGLCLVYGFCVMPLPQVLEGSFWNWLVRILLMGVGATILEYLAGVICLDFFHVRLWDYRDRWGNIRGLICPLFTFFWTILGVIYDLLIHPYIMSAVEWLARNLAFSFFIGLFFGILFMDVMRSAQIVAKLKQYAEENQVILRYETIKDQIRSHHIKTKQKYRFFETFHTNVPLVEHLRDMRGTFEKVKQKVKKN